MSTLTVLFICRSLLYVPGVKPSVDCTDPSSESPNCSCTCTNGITFNQSLSSTFPTDTISGPSIDECQADKTQCLSQKDELKAQLDRQEQEHLLRVEQLQTELKKHKPDFQYLGCYSDGDRKLLGGLTISSDQMTTDMCAINCFKHQYHGLVNGVCYCDNTFRQTLQKVDDSRCEFKCPGNSAKKCGGAWVLSVFTKTT
ncbi:hypothetical protein BKA58DRAFT_379094 [Alternaria rosae]|uniref:uncharacterized protein n=1 Tax=Alternaria rosae TaxID=1187941 RepID=UPI001E8DF3F1|nr:uncharacterized protein BKA58DRAFT_379094 [Alternaria rosae]KAH6875025.1 hypothetical protein BKA58DRAFT_379094 [Alternaria rosae]